MAPRRILVALLAALIAACGSARKVESTDASASSKCTRCHGGVETSGGAPPRGLGGESATTALAVGAHTAHVSGPSHLSAPLGCDACHPAPPADAPMSHVNARLEVHLGVLASAGGVTPVWDRDSATCTVYCHGASMAQAGGSLTTPVWTRVDGTQRACGACHGAPPPAPHPQRADCERCHEGSLTPSSAEVAPKHMNGALDLSVNCASCHGDPARAGSATVKAAPPQGTHGETATTEVAVGAHERHVLGGSIAGPVACESCHVVPSDPGHSNGVVELAFSGLAVAPGAPAPSFDPSDASCSSTYCHGVTLAAGTNRKPIWTRVDGTQAACGTCHGAPPTTPPHTPASTGCWVCHPGTVKADGTIDLAGGMHVNGSVDVNDVHPADWSIPTKHGYAANADLASCKACHGADLEGGITGVSCDTCHPGGSAWKQNCVFCHGDGNRTANKPAPPVGTQGEVATSERAVGAHQAHLGASHVSGPIACGECHATPADISHVTGTVSMTWGPIASGGGVTPALNPDATCTVYCHGASLSAGGSVLAPLWTKVDGTQAACGACHGAPPPSPHPQIATCKSCHPETMSTDTTIDLAGGKHIDGVVEKLTYHPDGWSDPTLHGLAANADLASCKSCHGSDLAGGTVGISCATCHGTAWQSNCAFCHGDGSRAGSLALKAAPPQGTQNETATTARAVGAHQAHVNSGPLSNAFGCDVCHTVPADLSHVDGTPAVSFGGVGNAGGVGSSWNGATCTTYCHGTTLPGGANTAPQWTKVDGTQAACGACHGAPPPSPHPQNASCDRCHTGYASGSVNLAHHVNGTIDLDGLTCASCHGDDQRAGTDLQKAAPPIGTAGETDSTTRAVGAHQAHVYGSRWSNGIACTECHAVPTSLGHANGTVDLAFGPLANLGTTTSWNGATCATSYCHGPSSTAPYPGTNQTPAWTGGSSQADCGTCHAVGTALRPPGSYHYTHRSITCDTCHGVGYSGTTVNKATHIDGIVQKPDCTVCHNDLRGGTTRRAASSK